MKGWWHNRMQSSINLQFARAACWHNSFLRGLGSDNQATLPLPNPVQQNQVGHLRNWLVKEIPLEPLVFHEGCLHSVKGPPSIPRSWQSAAGQSLSGHGNNGPGWCMCQSGLRIPQERSKNSSLDHTHVYYPHPGAHPAEEICSDTRLSDRLAG